MSGMMKLYDSYHSLWYRRLWYDEASCIIAASYQTNSRQLTKVWNFTRESSGSPAIWPPMHTTYLSGECTQVQKMLIASIEFKIFTFLEASTYFQWALYVYCALQQYIGIPDMHLVAEEWKSYAFPEMRSFPNMTVMVLRITGNKVGWNLLY